ncbi:uncharacterized protein ZC3H3 isoform X2 [Planococcus citri]|uniref:uncharacterized protein ZC3H3 isoform X2 n=1 Tax=Planococcus citri TaxID=170843 RepID=UPI0031F86D65
MYSNNPSLCNHKVHVNPLFSYHAHKSAYSSEATVNHDSSQPPNNSTPFASVRLGYNNQVDNSFNNFIKEKFYELSAVMYRDSVNKATAPSQQVASEQPKPTSKYKWENQKSTNVCDTPSANDSVPFHSVFSKGWFFHNSCDTTCISSSPLDIQSCCFINDRYLPQNTLNVPDLKKRVLDFYKKKTAASSNNHSLISISKHKLIKKTGVVPLKENVTSKSPSQKRRSSNVPVLCTRSKLIRKNKPVAISMSLVNKEKLMKNLSKNFIIKRHSLVRINQGAAEDVVKTVHKRKRLNSSRASSTSSVVVLTKRKLIRKSTPTIQTVSPLVSISKHKLRRRKVDENLLPLVSISKHKLSRVVVQNREPQKTPPEAERLISINPNKLIRSSLLPKVTKSKNQAFFSNSVLYNVIRHRRRIHRGSGYVLLTRNKLIKRAKFKNKIWRRHKSEDGLPKNCFNKMFVSLGNNKLIRKSLFAKNNKTDAESFTNHLTRTKLRYASERNTSMFRTRYSNKHKNNRKIIRKKKNSICPVYRKKGTCAKLLKGDCYRIHDRKYVALCQNFIRGNCDEKDCLLSHDLTSKKISICRRFLKNNCSYENCPYVHAKPTLEAPICAQFLQGYCEDGERCSNWHIFACPEFKENSCCSKKDTCRLPHRDLSFFQGKDDDSDDEEGHNWRYFEKNKIDERDLKSISIIPERHLLGDLPDFIPI